MYTMQRRCANRLCSAASIPQPLLMQMTTGIDSNANRLTTTNCCAQQQQRRQQQQPRRRPQLQLVALLMVALMMLLLPDVCKCQEEIVNDQHALSGEDNGYDQGRESYEFAVTTIESVTELNEEASTPQDNDVPANDTSTTVAVPLHESSSDTAEKEIQEEELLTTTSIVLTEDETEKVSEPSEQQSTDNEDNSVTVDESSASEDSASIELSVEEKHEEETNEIDSEVETTSKNNDESEQTTTTSEKSIVVEAQSDLTNNINEVEHSSIAQPLSDNHNEESSSENQLEQQTPQIEVHQSNVAEVEPAETSTIESTAVVSSNDLEKSEDATIQLTTTTQSSLQSDLVVTSAHATDSLADDSNVVLEASKEDDNAFTILLNENLAAEQEDFIENNSAEPEESKQSNPEEEVTPDLKMNDILDDENDIVDNLVNHSVTKKQGVIMNDVPNDINAIADDTTKANLEIVKPLEVHDNEIESAQPDVPNENHDDSEGDVQAITTSIETEEEPIDKITTVAIDDSESESIGTVTPTTKNSRSPASDATMSIDASSATIVEGPQNTDHLSKHNLAIESTNGQIVGSSGALPSTNSLSHKMTSRSMAIIVVCSCTAMVFVIISVTMFLISFQRQRGTLDIEKQERFCGKDYDDATVLSSDGIGARLQLLEIELTPIKPLVSASSSTDAMLSDAAENETDDCL